VPSYHCELAWLGGDRPSADVLVVVDGERIRSVEVGVTCPDGAERLRGVVLPGLANAHSHAFHRALRSRTQAGEGTFWTWREQMYSLAATLEPDAYLELARAAYGEMVLAGITCVGEFHYLHHGREGRRYGDANLMGNALVQAASEAGVRLTLLDTCYLHGGIGQPLDEVQQRFSDGSAPAWAERVSDLTVPAGARLGAAVHSVRAVDPDAIAMVAAWAGERGLPLHAHVSEQQAENEQCLAAFGRTPTELLHACGALTAGFTAVHATHLTAADIHRLGSSASTVCLCPTTERDLADGIGPARALRGAGARLSLGSDSHAVVDLFEEARAVELDERLATNARGGHRAADLLRAATVDGHRSLGWPDAGRIEPGALADLVCVRLGSVRTAGTRPEQALEAAVFAATAADVTDVVVGGRVVVRGGTHRWLDVEGELARAVGRP
jgi:formiminoglutamate deiminase